jgi:hypothetical protein
MQGGTFGETCVCYLLYVMFFSVRTTKNAPIYFVSHPDEPVIPTKVGMTDNRDDG